MFKVMTLNLWGYHDWNTPKASWDQRLANIFELAKQERPDVIALQEVLTNHAFSDWPQSDLIANQAGYKYRVNAPTLARNNSRDREGNRTQRAPHGQAVISKYPIVTSESYFVRLYPEYPEECSVLFCKIDTPDGAVDLCDVHFANSDIAYKHLDQLLDLVAARNVRPIILGDFNIYNLAAYKQKNTLLQEYTLSSELAEYISYPDDKDTLDYIIAPSESIKLSNILCPNTYVSDHRALLADIEVE